MKSGRSPIWMSPSLSLGGTYLPLIDKIDVVTALI